MSSRESMQTKKGQLEEEVEGDILDVHTFSSSDQRGSRRQTRMSLSPPVIMLVCSSTVHWSFGLVIEWTVRQSVRVVPFPCSILRFHGVTLTEFRRKDVVEDGERQQQPKLTDKARKRKKAAWQSSTTDEWIGVLRVHCLTLSQHSVTLEQWATHRWRFASPHEPSLSLSLSHSPASLIALHVSLTLLDRFCVSVSDCLCVSSWGELVERLGIVSPSSWVRYASTAAAAVLSPKFGQVLEWSAIRPHSTLPSDPFCALFLTC